MYRASKCSYWLCDLWNLSESCFSRKLVGELEKFLVGCHESPLCHITLKLNGAQLFAHPHG